MIFIIFTKQTGGYNIVLRQKCAPYFMRFRKLRQSKKSTSDASKSFKTNYLSLIIYYKSITKKYGR